MSIMGDIVEERCRETWEKFKAEISKLPTLDGYVFNIRKEDIDAIIRKYDKNF